MQPLDILFADDDDQLRHGLCPQLEAEGHAITCVEDGAAAIEELRQKRFDVVVTDIVMPHKDGFDVIQAVKKVRPGTRIVAMSGGDRGSPTDYLPTAIAFGAHAILAKPFSYSELLAALTEAVA